MDICKGVCYTLACMSMESITEVKYMRIDVLGVGFDNLTMTEAVSRGAALLEEPGAHYVVTPNPEIV